MRKALINWQSANIWHQIPPALCPSTVEFLHWFSEVWILRWASLCPEYLPAKTKVMNKVGIHHSYKHHIYNQNSQISLRPRRYTDINLCRLQNVNILKEKEKLMLKAPLSQQQKMWKWTSCYEKSIHYWLLLHKILFWNIKLSLSKDSNLALIFTAVL